MLAARALWEADRQVQRGGPEVPAKVLQAFELKSPLISRFARTGRLYKLTVGCKMQLHQGGAPWLLQ
jgi:hypothetical protein